LDHQDPKEMLDNLELRGTLGPWDLQDSKELQVIKGLWDLKDLLVFEEILAVLGRWVYLEQQENLVLLDPLDSLVQRV
jgi:hypothetical protein